MIEEKSKDTGKDKIAVKAQYTLLQPGLLTPGRPYYWRVRAMDDKGAWGPWSKIWTFIPRGPAYPLNVTLDYDQTKGAGILRWKANPAGRLPAKYRVYGSDEKGLTISDPDRDLNMVPHRLLGWANATDRLIEICGRLAGPAGRSELEEPP